MTRITDWMNWFETTLRRLPFIVGPTDVTRPGLCAGPRGAAGQNCVLHALEVMGRWWGRQPAAGRPCRRHWMDRVWTPPPQDTEHWHRDRNKKKSRMTRNPERRHRDVNKGRRSSAEVQGEKRDHHKRRRGRREEKSMRRQRTDEENKHPIQHVLALQQAVGRYLLRWKRTEITSWRSSRIRHCAGRGCPSDSLHNKYSSTFKTCCGRLSNKEEALDRVWGPPNKERTSTTIICTEQSVSGFWSEWRELVGIK